MSASQPILETIRTEAVWFGPFDPPVFRVTGRDAVRYLHGRLTQEIKGLIPGRAADGMALTPQGRVQAHLTIIRSEQSFLLVSDPLGGEDRRTETVKAILQFKVADDVTLESTPLRQVIVAGPTAQSIVSSVCGTAALENLSHAAFENGTILRRDRGQLQCFELYLENPDDLTQRLSAAGAKSGDAETLEIVRIAAKLPRVGAEITDKTLGPELDVSRLVSFNKGCYSGQEVVEMATARGRPNRELCLFEGHGETALSAGAELHLPDSPEKSVGILTSVCVLAAEKKILALGFVKAAAVDAERFVSSGIELRRIG